MKGDDVKALRQAIGCTARDLAGALGLEQADVLAWERGELFPTKRYVTKMESFRASGLPKAARTAAQRPAASRPRDV
ncbi:MAG TPA: XRE family transcriptional regulator, partial [Byssovorax sp.]